MFIKSTGVWLDAHARSVAAAAIDDVMGELLQAKLARPMSTSGPRVGEAPPAEDLGVPIGGDAGRDQYGHRHRSNAFADLEQQGV